MAAGVKDLQSGAVGYTTITADRGAARTDTATVNAAGPRSANGAAYAAIGLVGEEVTTYAPTLRLTLRTSAHPTLASLPSRAGVATRAAVERGAQISAGAVATTLSRHAGAAAATAV